MRVLLTGASGQLGAYVLARLRALGADVVGWSGRSGGALFNTPLRPVDLAVKEQVREAFAAAEPEVVIHTAAMSAIADAVARPEEARAVNTEGTCLLARLCDARGARIVYVSTDLVFDGETSPGDETTAPWPLSIYARTKLAAEPAVLAVGGLVVRVSLLFGPALIARPTFFDQMLAKLRGSEPVTLFDDEWRTPLDLDTAAAGICRAALSDQQGLLHWGGSERLSRIEMGQRLAALCGTDPQLVRAVSRLTVGGEPRPRDTSFDSTRFARLFPDVQRPSYDEAVKSFLAAQH